MAWGASLQGPIQHSTIYSLGPPAESSDDPQAYECRLDEKACNNSFCPVFPWNQAPSSPSQTSRPPSPCFLLCCSSCVRNSSCRCWESHGIIHLCSPSYNSLWPARWCSADTFDCLADKCFIPPPHLVVQILSFIFRLQGFSWVGSHVLLGRGQWGLWLRSYKLCMISKYSTLIFLAQSSYWSAPPE